MCFALHFRLRMAQRMTSQAIPENYLPCHELNLAIKLAYHFQVLTVVLHKNDLTDIGMKCINGAIGEAKPSINLLVYQEMNSFSTHTDEKPFLNVVFSSNQHFQALAFRSNNFWLIPETESCKLQRLRLDSLVFIYSLENDIYLIHELYGIKNKMRLKNQYAVYDPHFDHLSLQASSGGMSRRWKNLFGTEIIHAVSSHSACIPTNKQYYVGAFCEILELIGEFSNSSIGLNINLEKDGIGKPATINGSNTWSGLLGFLVREEADVVALDLTGTNIITKITL